MMSSRILRSSATRDGQLAVATWPNCRSKSRASVTVRPWAWLST